MRKKDKKQGLEKLKCTLDGNLLKFSKQLLPLPGEANPL